MAGALLLAVLVARLAALLPGWGEEGSGGPGGVRAAAEATRLVVGLPVCVVAVLLLADRYACRRGALVLAAGAVWIGPPALLEVLAGLWGQAVPVAAVTLLLAASATACQPLTVLLLPLCLLPSPFPPGWRRGVVAGCAVVTMAYALVWGLGTPGLAGVPSPWSGTGPGEWAGGLLHESQDALDAMTLVVATAVTADLAWGALRAPERDGRRVRALIAVAYPVCVCLLLSDLWSERGTVVARSAGVAVWLAVICGAASRGGLWRLERVTSHRLARAFVLAVLAVAAAVAGTAAWTAHPAGRSAETAVAVGCALVAGWAARPLVRHASLAVERAFYGPRARPHEAVRALAARLQHAPYPSDVPEQICRSVVEDLGLSGARIAVETRSGPRLLAAAGAPVGEPVQVFLLRHHGQVVGRLEASRDGASTPEERDGELLSLLADQASPALAALRLGEEAQMARERLVLAREEERRRLRREIHDGLGPQLAAVQLRLGTAQACMADVAASGGAARDGASPASGGPGCACPADAGGLPGPVEGGGREFGSSAGPAGSLGAAGAQLRAAAEVLGEALAEIRRITAGLTPALLVERGLFDATRLLARRLTTEAVEVVVDDPVTPLPPPAPAVETAAYRIAAEAITNAVRHARARHVRVAFTAGPAELTVTVADDGAGFAAGVVPGTGLASLVERAEEIGGSATIDTTPDGTTITATLPTMRTPPAAPATALPAANLDGPAPTMPLPPRVTTPSTAATPWPFRAAGTIPDMAATTWRLQATGTSPGTVATSWRLPAIEMTASMAATTWLFRAVGTTPGTSATSWPLPAAGTIPGGGVALAAAPVGAAVGMALPGAGPGSAGGAGGAVLSTADLASDAATATPFPSTAIALPSTADADTDQGASPRMRNEARDGGGALAPPDKEVGDGGA